METDACVIADVNGVILMWYLPGLLSPKRQVRAGVPNACHGTFLIVSFKETHLVSTFDD